MIKRSIGSTGLMVSTLGLGCNNFGRRLDLGKTRTVVDSAIEAGINFFDTADVYGDRGGSETLLGATLGNRRKDVILATKFGLLIDDEGRLAGGSRRYVLSAVEASLKRLKSRSFERQHHLVNKVRRVIWRGPPRHSGFHRK